MDNTLLYSFINDIGNRLCEPNIYGSASVMIGAGFSKNAKSLGDKATTPPNWSQLAGEMFDELYPAGISGNDMDRNNQRLVECSGKNVLTLAQKYEVAFDRQKLNNLIERKIADEMYIPDELHYKMLELNWNDVFTTNYDTLLERSISKITKKRNYKVVYSQSDLPGSVRPRIVKLHGSVAHSGNYIITEEDYRTYPVKYTPFVNTVQQSMIETKLCLMGFSGDDPNFLNWLGWLRDNMGENCQQIYLCGLFENMNYAERKVLENRKIAIVDISELAGKESENRYYAALSKFLDLLTESTKNKENSIFNDKIYSKVRFATDLKNLKTYYHDMLNYTNELIEEIRTYVCLPSKIEEMISENIQNHFNAVLYDDEKEKRLELIGNFSYILRRVNRILYDNYADKLTEIIDLSANRAKDNVNAYFNIIIYLLVMYRIDANEEMYKKYVGKLDEIDTLLNSELRNEYYIELGKHAISVLDYDKAVEYIDNIEPGSKYETAIKKACLLRQINEKEKALGILKECAASLAQKNYSDNKMASLIGYINLCARSILEYGHNLDAFSDDDYYTNDYNCRKIVVQSKDIIIEQLFKNKNKENTKEFAFNPNSYTMHYTMGSTNEGKVINTSFQYLLLQDSLCLPVYRDQKSAIETAVNIINHTSKSPLWKWTRIVSMNDEKMINSYFTRERIYRTEIQFVEQFFDQIMQLWGKIIQKDSLDNVYRVLTEKTIVDILSRLSVIIDEIRIADFLHDLVRLNDCRNEERKNVFNAIERIKYSFNTKILELCLDDIFEKLHYQCHIASYFNDMYCIEIESPNLDNYVKDILKDLEDDNLEIRDNALAKIVLLNKMNKLSEYYEEVANKIWAKLDDNGFPLSSLYLPVIWEELPHVKVCNFEDCYKKYLLTPNFIRCVNGGTISSGNNVDARIYSYGSCFYRLTNIGNGEDKAIVLDSTELLAIMEYLYDYVNNEKKILDTKYDLFGNADSAKERFIEIGKLISFIYIYGNITSGWNGALETKLLEFIKLYDGISIELNNVNIVRKINTDTNSFSEFEKLILSGNSSDISIAFVVLHGMLKVFEKENKVGVIEKEIIDFINKFPYIEADVAKSILIQMFSILKRKIFLKMENQIKVIDVFSKCYVIYYREFENKGKIALDAMYNVSQLMQSYYQWLLKNSIVPNVKFEELKEQFRNNKLNEIRIAWKD